MKRCVWVKFSINLCMEIAIGSSTFLWLLHFLTSTSAGLFLPLENGYNTFFSRKCFCCVAVPGCSSQTVCSVEFCYWLIVCYMTLCTVVYMTAYFFAVTTREREREFQWKCATEYVNDDLWISPSFITTLVVSKSNIHIGPEDYNKPYWQLDP